MPAPHTIRLTCAAVGDRSSSWVFWWWLENGVGTEQFPQISGCFLTETTCFVKWHQIVCGFWGKLVIKTVFLNPSPLLCKTCVLKCCSTLPRKEADPLCACEWISSCSCLQTNSIEVRDSLIERNCLYIVVSCVNVINFISAIFSSCSHPLVKVFRKRHWRSRQWSRWGATKDLRACGRLGN